jgi:hypothetical protein
VRHLLIAAVISGVLIAGPLAGSALAHVEANAAGATEGGSGTVTFSAESEETTPLKKIEIVLPTDTPLGKVGVPPKDGWTSAVSDADSASGEATVSRVTWTATMAGVEPGKTGKFSIQVGRFPDAAQVVFKALVTYADGTVVSWIELQAPGGPEPDHPAPILKLAPAAAGASTTAATVAITTAATAAPAAHSADAGGGRSAGAISAPVVIVIVIVVAVVAALVTAARRRRQAR